MFCGLKEQERAVVTSTHWKHFEVWCWGQRVHILVAIVTPPVVCFDGVETGGLTVHKASHSESAPFVIVGTLLVLKACCFVLQMAIAIKHNALDVVVEIGGSDLKRNVFCWPAILNPVLFGEFPLRCIIKKCTKHGVEYFSQPKVGLWIMNNL